MRIAGLVIVCFILINIIGFLTTESAGIPIKILFLKTLPFIFLIIVGILMIILGKNKTSQNNDLDKLYKLSGRPAIIISLILIGISSFIIIKIFTKPLPNIPFSDEMAFAIPAFCILIIGILILLNAKNKTSVK